MIGQESGLDVVWRLTDDRLTSLGISLNKALGFRALQMPQVPDQVMTNLSYRNFNVDKTAEYRLSLDYFVQYLYMISLGDLIHANPVVLA